MSSRTNLSANTLCVRSHSYLKSQEIGSSNTLRLHCALFVCFCEGALECHTARRAETRCKRLVNLESVEEKRVIACESGSSAVGGCSGNH